MIDLHEIGVLKYLKRKYYRILEESQCDPALTVGSEALGLGDVWPIFVVSGVGLGLALTCFLLEFFYFAPGKTNNRK